MTDKIRGNLIISTTTFWEKYDLILALDKWFDIVVSICTMIFDVFLFVKTCNKLILEEHSTVNSSITHTPLGKSPGYGFLKSMWFGYSGNVGTKIYCMYVYWQLSNKWCMVFTSTKSVIFLFFIFYIAWTCVVCHLKCLIIGWTWFICHIVCFIITSFLTFSCLLGIHHHSKNVFVWKTLWISTAGLSSYPYGWNVGVLQLTLNHPMLCWQAFLQVEW